MELSILKKGYLDLLDEKVKMLTNQGLGVTLDIHPWDNEGDPHNDFKWLVTNDPKARERFAAMWAGLIDYAKDHGWPADKVFFQILNEPMLPLRMSGTHAELEGKWRIAQQEIVDTIRQKADPTNEYTLVATTATWENPSAAVPVAGKNIVYDIHFYVPFDFTHQKADLKYPMEKKDLKRVSPALAQQFPNGLNRAALEPYIKAIADWRDTYQIPVVVGEFGVSVRDKGATDYENDVAWLLTQYGIPKSKWNLTGGEFGIATSDTPGNRTLDPASVNAVLKPRDDG
jgi:aryl-phospho-beta-D-glucosidase BglC (GH1 family)